MNEMQIEEAEERRELLALIPPKLLADLNNYVDFGIRTKGVDMLMSNDLFGFTMWIDFVLTPELMHALYVYVQDVPAKCFGNMDKVSAWGGEVRG